MSEVGVYFYYNITSWSILLCILNIDIYTWHGLQSSKTKMDNDKVCSNSPLF